LFLAFQLCSFVSKEFAPLLLLTREEKEGTHLPFLVPNGLIFLGIQFATRSTRISRISGIYTYIRCGLCHHLLTVELYDHTGRLEI
jgi:hypothetical protein